MSISGGKSVFYLKSSYTGRSRSIRLYYMTGYCQIAYADCPSIRIGYGTAEIHFHSRLAANKYLAFKKPGVADVFIKANMHPDRIAGFHFSFELRRLYSGQYRSFPPAPLGVSGFLQQFGHEQGTSLKNSFAEKNSGHYGIIRIMAFKKIKVR